MSQFLIYNAFMAIFTKITLKKHKNFVKSHNLTNFDFIENVDFILTYKLLVNSPLSAKNNFILWFVDRWGPCVCMFLSILVIHSTLMSKRYKAIIFLFQYQIKIVLKVSEDFLKFPKILKISIESFASENSREFCYPK